MRRRGAQRSLSDGGSVLSALSFGMPGLNLSLPNLRPNLRLGRNSCPRVSFEHLASHQKFRAITKLLMNEQMDDDTLRNWLNESCRHGETALHLLLRYQPPPKLVDLTSKKLISLADPETCCWNNEADAVFIPENSRDDQGRTPLHIAAEAGCHVEVIDRLLEGETCIMPALARDDYGRFPLHWACSNPSGVARGLSSRNQSSFRSFMSSSRRMTGSRRNTSSNLSAPELLENMMNVIRMLLKVYPEAASIPDEDGNTPYMLAKHFQADKSVLEVLAVTIKACRKSAGSTLCEDSDFTAFEVSLDYSRGSSCTEDVDFDDDVSSLGMEEGGPTKRGPALALPSLYRKRIVHPSDIIIDPDHKESKSVIDKCWFI